jgi:hypothetical protein
MFFAATLIVLLALSSVRATKEHPKRTREGAIICGLECTDLDGDGGVSIEEIREARKVALQDFGAPKVLLGPLVWFSNAAAVVSKATGIGNLVTVEQVLADCDADGDGIITRADYTATQETCLNTDGKVDDIYDYVCIPCAERSRVKADKAAVEAGIAAKVADAQASTAAIKAREAAEEAAAIKAAEEDFLAEVKETK